MHLRCKFVLRMRLCGIHAHRLVTKIMKIIFYKYFLAKIILERWLDEFT
jgi:hypothetical protein